MQKRYYLDHSSTFPNAGFTPIKLGLPIDTDMINDICLGCKGSYSYIELNSNILRQALLNDPEKTKQLLGVKVEDVLNKPEPQKKGAKSK